MYSQPFDAIAHSAYGLTRDQATTARAPAPVELRVADLDAARRFYFDLLGFVPAEGYGYSDSRVVLVSPLLAHGFRSIVLTRDRRAGTSHGLLLELEGSAELLDRYLLARLLGAPTSPLLTRGRSLTVTVKDPDGNEVELRARTGAPERAANGGRWGRAGVGEGMPPTRHGRGRLAAPEPAAEPDQALGWFDSLCEAEGHGEAPRR